MDVGRALLWFAVATLCSGIVGYSFGFAEAQPTIDALAIVGTAAVVVAASMVVAMLVGLIESLSLRALLTRLLLRTGFVWTGVAIVAGMKVGGFLGFAAGLRTAQSLSNSLYGVGLVVAAVLAGAALLIGIIYGVRARSETGRRR